MVAKDTIANIDNQCNGCGVSFLRLLEVRVGRQFSPIHPSCIEMSRAAEGVETGTQLEYLLEHECGLVQGFYYSRPVNVEGLVKLLEHGNERIKALIGAPADGAVEVVDFRQTQRRRRFKHA